MLVRRRIIAALFIVAIATLTAFQNCSGGFAVKDGQLSSLGSTQAATPPEPVTPPEKFTKVSITAPSTVDQETCSSAMDVALSDQDDKPVSAVSSLPIVVPALFNDVLFDDAACTVKSALQIPAGANAAKLYLKSRKLIQSPLKVSVATVESNPVDVLVYRHHLVSLDFISSTANAYTVTNSPTPTLSRGVEMQTALGVDRDVVTTTISWLNPGERILAVQGALFYQTNQRVVYANTLNVAAVLIAHPVQTIVIASGALCVLDHDEVLCGIQPPLGYDANYFTTRPAVKVPFPGGHVTSLQASYYGMCALVDGSVSCAEVAGAVVRTPSTVFGLEVGASEMTVVGTFVCALIDTSVWCNSHTNPVVASKRTGDMVVTKILGGGSQSADFYAQTETGVFQIPTTDASPSKGGFKVGDSNLVLQEAYLYYSHAATNLTAFSGCGRSNDKLLCWTSNGVPFEFSKHLPVN